MNVKEKLVELLDIIIQPGQKTLGDIAAYLITNGVTVQEWISVKDRLPEDSGYYLVAYRDKYNGSISIDFDMYVKCNVGEWWESEFACEGWYEVIKNWDDYNSVTVEDSVTHWMPLPEPPKGE